MYYPGRIEVRNKIFTVFCIFKILQKKKFFSFLFRSNYFCQIFEIPYSTFHSKLHLYVRITKLYISHLCIIMTHKNAEEALAIALKRISSRKIWLSFFTPWSKWLILDIAVRGVEDQQRYACINCSKWYVYLIF